MNKPLKVILFIGSLIIFSYGIHLFSEIKKSDDSVNSLVQQGDKISLPHTLLDTNGNEVSVDQLNGKYVGLYFSASWCGPCNMLKPMVTNVAKKFEGSVQYVYMDIDKFQDIAQMLEIQHIPKTFMIYKGDLVDQFGGVP